MVRTLLVFIARLFLMFGVAMLLFACAKKTSSESDLQKSSAHTTASSDITSAQAKMTNRELWDQMGKQLTFIQKGSHGPIIYDFTDTNCPVCHLIYTTEAPLINEGKLTVRYVPVAMIKPSSMPEAVAILQAKDPVEKLQRVEQRIGDSMKTGKPAHLPRAIVAIGLASHKTIELTKKIENNDDFLQKIGVNDLPDVIYMTKERKLGLITGLISQKQFTDLLPQLQ